MLAVNKLEQTKALRDSQMMCDASNSHLGVATATDYRVSTEVFGFTCLCRLTQ
jgi:hypothetical protein